MSETTQPRWDRLLTAAWRLIRADAQHSGWGDEDDEARHLFEIENALNELELAAGECGPVPDDLKVRLPEGATVAGLDEKWIAR